jgi:DNA polymerase sigma
MAKLTDTVLKMIQDEAEGIEYGSITIGLNASASTVNLTVTREVRVLKDDPESTRPGRVVVRTVSRP